MTVREYRPRVVPAADAAGVHGAARHPLWRISPDGTGETDADDPELEAVASGADLLRRTVRDSSTVGRDRGPVRVAERWRTEAGVTYHVAGRTAADAARLGDRLRDAYGEAAVAPVPPREAFPAVGADDHVAAAEFRLRRHRFHPLATATTPPDPYHLADPASGRPTVTDGGAPASASVRSVIQAVFCPASPTWTNCGFGGADWRDLLLRMRGVADLSSFARRIAAEGGVGDGVGDEVADADVDALADRIAARGDERAYTVVVRAAWFGERPVAVARRATAVATAFAAAFRGPTGQAVVPRSPADPLETLRDAVARWWGGGVVLPLTDLARVGPFPRRE